MNLGYVEQGTMCKQAWFSERQLLMWWFCCFFLFPFAAFFSLRLVLVLEDWRDAWRRKTETLLSKTNFLFRLRAFSFFSPPSSSCWLLVIFPLLCFPEVLRSDNAACLLKDRIQWQGNRQSFSHVIYFFSLTELSGLLGGI